MSAFVLKLIAVISMLFDHTGYLIFGKASFFNYIGRLAFPIFAFQIAEGYTHTKNLKKYILRLFVFALISQIPFQIFSKIFFDRFLINVLFTLLFGLMGIIIYDKYNKFLGILFIPYLPNLIFFLKIIKAITGKKYINIYIVFLNIVSNKTSVKPNAPPAKPIVEKENGTLNNLKNISCTKKYTVNIIAQIVNMVFDTFSLKIWHITFIPRIKGILHNIV